MPLAPCIALSLRCPSLMLMCCMIVILIVCLILFCLTLISSKCQNICSTPNAGKSYKANLGLSKKISCVRRVELTFGV